jgi:hypothetical protein
MIRAVAATMIFCTLCGCNALGYIANAAGNPDVPAQYVPAMKPTIVVVKDRPDPTGQSNESDELAGDIDDQLKMHLVVPVIPSVKAAAIRGAQLDDRIMTPAEVGRAAGAEQIIYVKIDISNMDVGPVNDVLKGQMSATVCVIDSATGKFFWPTDGSDGVSVSYETPMMHVADDVNRSTLRANLCAGLADQVARLFYKAKAQK